MNKIAIFLLAVALAGCAGKSASSGTGTVSDSSAAEAVNTADAPIIEFEKGAYDFGSIKQGEKVSYAFKFSNKGKSPLIISNATATCGCTTPEFPHEPIPPGKSGEIKVTFDSAGKFGQQDKVITVTSNAVPANAEVHLVGEVKEVQAKSN